MDGRSLRAGVAVLAVTLGLLLPACVSSPLDPAAARRIEVFDHCLDELEQGYPYFQRAGLGVDVLRDEYRNAAAFAERPHEFYHLLAGMLADLQDPHVSLEVPAGLLVEDGQAPTNVLDTPGLELAFVDGRHYVTGWPGEAEPLRQDGDPDVPPRLVRLEGHPFSLSLACRVLGQGPPGSPAELDLAWADGRLTRRVLRRPPARAMSSSPEGPVLHFTLLEPEDRAAVHREGRWARLEIGTFELGQNDAEGLASFCARLDELLDEVAAVDGLVLDLRDNTGGEGSAMGCVVGRFIDHRVVLPIGGLPRRFLGLADVFGQLVIEPRAPRCVGPVVVLTSAWTASSAEIAARVLQQEAGAVVVGERTAGAGARVVSVTLPDGSVLKYGRNPVTDVQGRGLQGLGVVPDVLVRRTLDEVVRLGDRGSRQDWSRRSLEAAHAVLVTLAARRAATTVP